MRKLPDTVKRVLSIAFVAFVVFFGAKTCETESAECELVFRIDDTSSKPRELELRLYEVGDDELIGQFRKVYDEGSGPEARWPLQVVAGDYRLEGELRLQGKRVPIRAEVELEDGSAKTIYLDRFVSEAAR